MKKIMFSDRYELTQAVLEGRKTMTRRIAHLSQHAADVLMGKIPDYPQGIVNSLWRKSKYKVGEIVAIAQSYKSLGMNPETALNDKDGIGFYTKTKFAPGWKNKMFVRVDLLPHHIRITDIRVERLQSISEEDCLKEGVELNTRQYEYDGTKRYCVRGLGHWRAIGCDQFNTPREAYAALIDKVLGKGTWDSNPYVFVYEFELID